MFPRLYAIIDADCFPEATGRAMSGLARSLVDAGVSLIQYRDKSRSARQVLSEARELSRVCGDTVRLVMNDRADLCLSANFDGVHVGQQDLSAEGARRVVGPNLWVGVSTHSMAQVEEADRTSADYIAVGPVFATASKRNPDPVIGLEGVRAARARTRKPLVAIGGITRGNCWSVLEAGADSVAVISDLLAEPAKAAQEFLRILNKLR